MKFTAYELVNALSIMDVLTVKMYNDFVEKHG